MELSVEELKALAGIVSNAPAQDTVPDDNCSVCDEPAVTNNLSDMRAMISAIENAEVVEDAEEELDEWENTPTGASGPQTMEQPPGETVDTSLRRHLGADPQHVKVEESALDDFEAKFEKPSGKFPCKSCGEPTDYGTCTNSDCDLHAMNQNKMDEESDGLGKFPNVENGGIAVRDAMKDNRFLTAFGWTPDKNQSMMQHENFYDWFKALSSEEIDEILGDEQFEATDFQFEAKSHDEDYHTSELAEAYSKFKKSPLSESSARDFIEYRDPEGHYIVLYSRKDGGYRVLGKGEYRGEFTHAGIFDDLDDAVEHAELTIDGLEAYLPEDGDQLTQYTRLLKQHDWYYDRSDNHSKWSAGTSERKQLKSMQPTLDPDFAIWNEHAPADFQKSNPVGEGVVEYVSEAPSNFVGWDAIFNGETLRVTKQQVKSLYDALRKAASHFNAPESKIEVVPVYEDDDALNEEPVDEDAALSPIAAVRTDLYNVIMNFADAVYKIESENYGQENMDNAEKIESLASRLESAMKRMGVDYNEFYAEDDSAEYAAMADEKFDALDRAYKSYITEKNAFVKLIRGFLNKGINLDGMKDAYLALVEIDKLSKEITTYYSSYRTGGDAISEGPWDSHNTDVSADGDISYRDQKEPEYYVRNKQLRKKSKKPLPTWNDAMALVAKLGGRASGWEVVMERNSVAGKTSTLAESGDEITTQTIEVDNDGSYFGIYHNGKLIDHGMYDVAADRLTLASTGRPYRLNKYPSIDVALADLFKQGELSAVAESSIASASKKSEAKRQVAIRKAKRMMKRTGMSAEKAAAEFDLLPADIASLNEFIDMDKLEKSAKDKSGKVDPKKFGKKKQKPAAVKKES